MKSNIPLKHLVIIFLIILMPLLAICQGGDGDPELPGGDPDAEVAVPLDNGIIWLLIAGVAYGLKRVSDERKKTIVA